MLPKKSLRSKINVLEKIARRNLNKRYFRAKLSPLENFKELNLKPISRYGRGNKNNVPGAFDNLTKAQRQKTPEKLYKSIITQCLNKIPGS